MTKNVVKLGQNTQNWIKYLIFEYVNQTFKIFDVFSTEKSIFDIKS